jgi:hypothetical protein
MRLNRTSPAADRLCVLWPSRPQRGRGALMLRSGALRTLLVRYCSTATGRYRHISTAGLSDTTSSTSWLEIMRSSTLQEGAAFARVSCQAVQFNLPAVQSNVPAVQCNLPAVQCNLPAVQCSLPADSPHTTHADCTVSAPARMGQLLPTAQPASPHPGPLTQGPCRGGCGQPHPPPPTQARS